MTAIITAYIVKSLWWIIPSVLVLTIAGIVEKLNGY